MAVKWWMAWKTSKPLDVGAEIRYQKRLARMTDVLFIAACKLSGIEPTKRQARKWNNGKGKALLFRNDAREVL